MLKHALPAKCVLNVLFLVTFSSFLFSGGGSGEVDQPKLIN